MLPAIIAVVVFLSGLFFYLNSELYGKSKPKRKINIFGEYSLWVEDSGDELTIKWLTVGKDPGYLKFPSELARIELLFWIFARHMRRLCSFPV